jgi:hypothetical protein
MLQIVELKTEETYAVVGGLEAAKQSAIGRLPPIVADVVRFFKRELREEQAMKR